MHDMKNMVLIMAVMLTSFSGSSASQLVPAPSAQAPAPQTPPATTSREPPEESLNDLDAMTFGCPKAGLNAAAREAAKVPSQGTYQFSFFRIVNESHHAAYEVHFKSNYAGETDLKYCVVVYCQQGWDPKTTKTEVTLMMNERRPAKAPAHAVACAAPAPVKVRVK
jgi:hypothetical protein